MTIDIICPLYNAETYIKNLNDSLLKQEKVKISNITYILTDSKDNSEKMLLSNNCKYKKIKREEFSHSIVREKAAFESQSDIVVFITQDILIDSKDWLYKLTKDINDEIICTYSRQISKFNNIEKYTRESNYPAESVIKCEKDIQKLGLKTFFSSDASCAINRKKFIELNGYDNKDLPINEDMYYSYKVIMNGYKIKYCANSIIYHSHNFTLKEIYERYKLTGKFFKENSYLDNYGTKESGFSLAKYVLKRIIEEKRLHLLLRYPFDMAARLVGMKAGKIL